MCPDKHVQVDMQQQQHGTTPTVGKCFTYSICYWNAALSPFIHLLCTFAPQSALLFFFGQKFTRVLGGVCLCVCVYVAAFTALLAESCLSPCCRYLRIVFEVETRVATIRSESACVRGLLCECVCMGVCARVCLAIKMSGHLLLVQLFWRAKTLTCLQAKAIIDKHSKAIVPFANQIVAQLKYPQGIQCKH